MLNVPFVSRATVRCLFSATSIMLLVHGQAALAQFQHRIPLVMSASNSIQQGFVRVINFSDRTGTVRVHAIDDSGRRFGPMSFTLGANETKHFNSDDLERGNPSKGLSGGVGDGHGNWRLEIETSLDIAPLAYIRTRDGFLTSIHETAAAQGTSMRYHVPIFNPASNYDQQSRLRLINPGSASAEIEIDGLDDRGRAPPMGTVSLTLRPGEARVLTAQQLEHGGSGFNGRFGDGTGKWQLFVSARTPLQVMSLLLSRTGNITNLSRSTSSGERSVPLVMSASNSIQQGFVRVINFSDRTGTVRVHAIDDSGRRFGPMSFTLGANETKHFNSDDLERGNPSKGLSGGVGDGHGNWRLEIETSLDIAPLAYIRTRDGFLTSIHETAAAQGTSMRYHVPIFNPASNYDQQSRLRLINPGSASAEIEIDGLDDRGRAPPMGTVSLTLRPGEARVLTAQQLEHGGSGFNGRFGDGTGKWQLFVSARTPLQVMSLLLSRTGNITNLSGPSVVPANPGSRPVAHQVSLSSDLSTPYIEAQLIGTDPDGDTLMYVLDGPSSGPGYRNAFVEPNNGRLYAELDPGDRDRVEIPYKVTDGTIFSERALVIVTIQRTPSGGLGNLAQDLGEYGIIAIDYFDLRDLPRAVDLSGNFPTPGNQGRQGSCVGWATAYALKSYQERLEEGWEFSDYTTFSPAWIYNQVKEPGPCDNPGDRYDCGTFIHKALNFMIDKGTATLSKMPYTDRDYRARPSAAAIQEAARFKSKSMSSVRSVEHIKGAIANRHPIVIGMSVYRSFHRLSGSGSVYNDLSGASGGGHAVTIVGYDDDRFGGAFKVVNSWGQRWGDGGFFWLPYSIFSDSRLNAYAYVLVDRENDDDGEGPEPPTPPPCGQGDARPNLVPVSWSARYNSQPGGTGTWQYRVSNTGQATAATGVDVNLILSTDRTADASDHWVTWEEIPFAIRPGYSAVRDADNPLRFRFPDTISPGTYNMALWVDDVNEVRECNETDNVSFGRNLVNFRSSLPDIAIVSWWARWFTGSGNGQLQYRVTNKGTATITRTDWDINLVLHTLRNPADRAGRSYFLFYEDASHVLRPNAAIFRDSGNPASFNLYRDEFGNTVPAGTYYMSLWVDDLGQVRESNEWNNVSIGTNRVTIGRGRSVEQESDVVSQVDRETTPAEPEFESTFNGKVLPDPLWRQVEIVDHEDGTRELIFLAQQSQPEPTGTTVGAPATKTSEDVSFHEKSNSSSDIVVYPSAGVLRMP